MDAIIARSVPLLAELRAPFILLEDRLDPACPAKLYREPLEVVRCFDPSELDLALGRIEEGLDRGLLAAGLLSYELGYALEPRLAVRLPHLRTVPLLWFGLFERAELLPAERLDAAFAELGPPPPVAELRPQHRACDHIRKVERILELIASGDLYQANLTFPMRFRYAGDRLALYAALRTRQPVAHGGLAVLGDLAVLSVSPELWVEVADGQAVARPMKGTAARDVDRAQDEAARHALAADPKQLAENLMIVDLLRNDLARIADPGTVRTPALFTVETYPTLHTLTSTVTARLRRGVTLRERLAALFPCGSVVGAPKIRAGEVLRDLEAEARGVYTGGLGVLGPDGDMRFNVAIRTAVIGADGQGSYGVGGGIVADSDPAAEYEEALLKARVLSDLAVDYELLETFRWSAEGGFVRLGGHLDRLAASAGQLGFAFDRDAASAELARQARTWGAGDTDRRVRLALARSGEIAVTEASIGAEPARPVRLALAEDRLDAGDPFLRHKTSRREVHEAALAQAVAAGLDEAVLLNRASALADGARNSIFVQCGGRLLTPPVQAGALPGVLRATLIAERLAEEAPLDANDLQGGAVCFVGNSLRGLRRAVLAPPPGR